MRGQDEGKKKAGRNGAPTPNLQLRFASIAKQVAPLSDANMSTKETAVVLGSLEGPR